MTYIFTEPIYTLSFDVSVDIYITNIGMYIPSCCVKIMWYFIKWKYLMFSRYDKLNI